MTFSNIHLSNQKHGHWKDYRHPPKAVVEKVYESNPQVQLPTNLTGRPVTSSRSRRTSALGPPYPYPPNPFPGWTPYPAFDMPVPYHLYTTSSSANAPHYSPHFTKSPSDVPPGPLTEDGQIHRSPSDDDEDIQYPSITEFFTELEKTSSSEHYFESYTAAFHDNGYYRIDELADEGLTVGHMMEIVNHLKEGTARVIKREAMNKVKKIHKGKGRK